MQPKQIQFVLSETITQDTNTNTSKLITSLITDVVKDNRGASGIGFLFKEFLNVHRRNQIGDSLLADYKITGVEYLDVAFDEVKITECKPVGYDGVESKWYSACELRSVPYNCLEILPDYTFVCHKPSKSEIEFIKIDNSNVKAHLL